MTDTVMLELWCARVSLARPGSTAAEVERLARSCLADPGGSYAKAIEREARRVERLRRAAP